MLFSLIIIFLDLIIIFLQILVLRNIKRNEIFNKFVRERFWSMTIDIGKLKNIVKEKNNELSV